jgi:hypothetical protein
LQVGAVPGNDLTFIEYVLSAVGELSGRALEVDGDSGSAADEDPRSPAARGASPLTLAPAIPILCDTLALEFKYLFLIALQGTPAKFTVTVTDRPL